MVVAKAHLGTIYKGIDMTKIMMIFLAMLLVGCANDARLGHSVALVNATQENLLEVPDGTGERMQTGYDRYVGRGENDLSGSSSQILEDFN
ncbi:hypothetical protein AB6D67_08000 [Vibrio splendidus]